MITYALFYVTAAIYITALITCEKSARLFWGLAAAFWPLSLAAVIGIFSFIAGIVIGLRLLWKGPCP